MALEFGTFATISDRRRLFTDEERERYFNILHPRFSTLWFAEHPQYDVLEAWTSAAYVAARHPRFKVGTLVLSQSYRNPGLLAKMGATLQRLSQGRLTMGLGAGWEEADYKAYNYDFPRPGVRVAQLAEAIEILRAMWTANPATYHGEYYRVEAADSADFVGSDEMQQYPGIGPSNHLGPTPQAAIEQIKPYRDLGVAQLIVGGSIEELRRFSEEVVPAFD
jgi:Luciferase-like monooxygenase